MSSNELETMSHPHTLDGVVNGDVSNINNSPLLPPTTPPAPQTEYPVDLTVVETRESSKSVAVSAGKRRKVSTTKTSNAPAERKTRSRVGTSHSLNPIKRPVPKYKSANQIKEATKSQRQKTLHKTFERHDTKLRELFHLTKFVTLVDYDAKTAKEDQSEVFEEVLPPLNTFPDLNSSKRLTSYGRRRQMRKRVDEFGQQDTPSTLKGTFSAPHLLSPLQNSRQQLRNPCILLSLKQDQRDHLEAMHPITLCQREAVGARPLYSLWRTELSQKYIKERRRMTNFLAHTPKTWTSLSHDLPASNSNIVPPNH